MKMKIHEGINNKSECKEFKLMTVPIYMTLIGQPPCYNYFLRQIKSRVAWQTYSRLNFTLV